MIRLPRLFPLILLGLLATPVRASPPIWVVHGPHATVVLFGSVHLLPPGLDWEPPALKTAVAEADDVWFEIPLDQGATLKAGQMAARLGMEPPGHSLAEVLTPDTRARLARAAQSCGLPLEGLNRLKPWYAELTLSVASIRQYGAGTENGVEQSLSASAGPVQRRAFETLDQQLHFFADAPEADQVASLEETLGELEEGPAGYRRLIDAWMAGDVGAIQAEALTPVIQQSPGIYKTLVVDRNRRWMGPIRARLAGWGEAVMVVGVGHLIGPYSVPALLRQAGYKVDGP